MEQQHDDNARAVVVRAMRSATGRESTTFGFSILVTVTFGLLQALHGTPVVPEIFMYAGGAVMSFTLLTGLLSHGFRRSMPQHHTETLALGTSLNIVSVGVGLGIALLIGTVMTNTFAWLIAPFAATVSYLLMESLETALAERIMLAKGDKQAPEVNP